jgi:hypothetical protein
MTTGQNDPWPGEKNRAPGTYHDKPENREPETAHIPLIYGPTVFRDGEKCPKCGGYGPHVCLK